MKGITDGMIEQIYSKTFNLGTYFKHSTVEEAEKVFKEHVYPAFANILGGDDHRASAPKPISEDVQPTTVKEEDDDLQDDNLPFDPVPDTKSEPSPSTPPPTKDKPTTDSQVENLKKEFGIGDL